MGTLSQVCLTSLQDCNLVRAKKPHYLLLSSANPRRLVWSPNPSRLSWARPRRSQVLEPLSALVTDMDTHVGMDLKVEIRNSTMIIPEGETARRTMFLSNTDQAVNIYAGGIMFFSANPDFPPEVMTQRFEVAYRKVLVHYDFLAGRLKWNPEQGRLEIECNSTGAGYVTASSKLSMVEIGDIVCPSPDFDQLVTRKWDKIWPKDMPLFILQVTSFKCGGMALGIYFNHTALDGIGLKVFFDHLASHASNKPNLIYLPCNDRRLLDARSPPRVTFGHPEFVNLGQNAPRGFDTNTAEIFVSKSDNLLRKCLYLSSEDIINLKQKAANNMPSNNKKFSYGVITGFNVLTAHIWRCMAIIRKTKESLDQEKLSSILFPINIRSRLRPRLPPSYTGNGIINGYSIATYGELEGRAFSSIVQKIGEGSSRVKDEYVRSVIDWRELHNGFVHGDTLLSSWWKLGLNDIEFPWGKAKTTCPTIHQWSNIVILLEDVREVRHKGVNVFVSLPMKELEVFEEMFYKFIS